MRDKTKDALDDLQYFSQESLKKIWLNKKDEIWNYVNNCGK